MFLQIEFQKLNNKTNYWWNFIFLCSFFTFSYILFCEKSYKNVFKFIKQSAHKIFIYF